MTVFWILAAIGAVMLGVSLLVGDVLDGVFDAIDFTDGYISTASVAGFLTAFGLTGGGLSGAGASVITASMAGIAVGVLFAVFAVKLTRGMSNMPTDGVPGVDDYVGATGVLVTGVGENGYGEVSLTIGGHRLKLVARAFEPIPTGMPVVVLEALSSTEVRVRAN